ncbi:MAG: TIGR03790 family protein [Planctomycetes bacterium]|nr:TIGR03790 family protein [Planctomycetota bacterium]
MTFASIRRFALALVLACTAAAPLAALDATRILVVYRTDLTWDGDSDGVQDSLEVAQYYMAKRGVPAANLLGISCANSNNDVYYPTAAYPSYVSEVVQPIKAKLAALGARNIDVLLMSYGLPFAVTDNSYSLDNALMGLNYFSETSNNISWMTNPYLEPNPTFGSDLGNFSHTQYKFMNTDMYLVSRLDGPRGVRGVLDMIDQALYADRFVGGAAGMVKGPVYVDSRGDKGAYTDASLTADADVQSGAYYSYAATDVNIAYGEHYVPGTGLVLKWEQSGGTIGDAGLTYADGSSAVSAPRALMYGGWYNYGNYKNVFDWLPGSVACDLNSSSLYYWQVRDPVGGAWAARAIGAGATMSCGVSGEPYTTGHTRPNILLYYMLKGYCFAEASTLSNPAIGWMSYALGDPLCAPMAAKASVFDTRAPQPAAPPRSGSNAQGTYIDVVVDNTIEPEAAKVQVDYGQTNSYGSTFTSGFGYFRRHHLIFPTLPASSPMHYRLTLTDPAGNVFVTGDYACNTDGSPAGGDTTAPVISGISANSITTSSATISWTTDEVSDSLVQYGTTTSYGSSSALDATLVTAHSVGLSGLTASTLYHYRVLSRDAAGNLATSGDNTFTTTTAADTTPPVISGIAAGSITTSGATITWTTNEASDSQVQYGTTTGYGSSSTLNASLVTAHSVALSGLAANTLYHYRVLSRDAAGNLATSGDNTFTTLAPPDTTPPVISAVSAGSITANAAVISWTTNEAADSQVQYGTTTAYGSQTTLNATKVTAHSVALSGLTASTLYHVRVLSRDAAGNLATSGDVTFTTTATPDTTPPVISGVTAGSITATSVVIIWTTNEASSSQVQFGPTTSYGSTTVLDASMVTGHSVALTGLAPSTVYHIRVLSRDAAGNLTTSGDVIVTTAAPATSSISAGDEDGRHQGNQSCGIGTGGLALLGIGLLCVRRRRD